MAGRSLTLVCLASHYKGTAFIKAAKDAGCKVILIAKEMYKDEPWPRELVDDIFFMPDLAKRPDIIHAVSYLARTHPIDQIIALDDYDVETAGHLREHFRFPGLGDTLSRNFRDKLAMRTTALAGGIPVPEFTGVFNYDRAREYMNRVPGPWLLKPRSEASAMGIKKINHPDELWKHLEALGDQQSFFHLERFVAGDVFHVDSLVVDGKVVFSIASKYAIPPMSVYHGGGAFLTRTLDRASQDSKDLLKLNEKLLKVLGMIRGANHAEFIKGQDGVLYFLECASRVGGANIAEAIQHATNINLWEEWARIEIANLRGEKYKLPKTRDGYAGVINCLSRQEYPDLSGYNDPEVVLRPSKKQHAGLVLASPDPKRLETLMEDYRQRFERDFLMVLPPRDKPE